MTQIRENEGGRGKGLKRGNKHKRDGFTWQHNFICWECGVGWRCWLNLQVLKLNKSFFPFDVKRASSSNDKNCAMAYREKEDMQWFGKNFIILYHKKPCEASGRDLQSLQSHYDSLLVRDFATSLKCIKHFCGKWKG